MPATRLKDKFVPAGGPTTEVCTSRKGMLQDMQRRRKTGAAPGGSGSVAYDLARRACERLGVDAPRFGSLRETSVWKANWPRRFFSLTITNPQCS